MRAIYLALKGDLMIIKKIVLKHFRNYEDLEVVFNKKINVFVGNNAQGKTNILESIYALAITKSHRTHIDDNLIQKDCKCCKVKGIIKKENETFENELEVLINSKGKKVSINKNPIKKISDYISYFNVIIFHPDDLDIIKGAPSERRKFLNVEIGQLDNRYLSILNNYNNILKNRNEYLKKTSFENHDDKYLSIITEQLANYAVQVFDYRQKFINDLNIELAEVNAKIKGLNSVQIKYDTSIEVSKNDKIKEALINKYQSTLQRDFILAQTTVGPHRDDFIFLGNEKNIKEFGSQGQQRLSVLCLKLAEIEIFKKMRDEYPVLLLDDIFSELDSSKRHNIIKYLNKKMQIIITTTDISDIEKTILKKASIFEVDKATVKELVK